MKIVPPEKGYPEFVRFRTPILRWALTALFSLGTLAFIAGTLLFYYLLSISPPAPMEATGQVVALKQVYVRSFEVSTQHWLSFGGVGLAIAAAIASMSIFGSKPEPPPKVGHALHVVWILIVALGFAIGAAVAIGGRLPFAMASLP